MKIRINGVTRDMSPEEEAQVLAEQAEAAHRTEEEILKDFLHTVETAVQKMLNDKATSLGYDSIITAVTYADDATVPKFQSDGTSLRIWRSLCWAKCYELIEVGEELTVDEVMAQMPEYEEIS